MFKHIDDFLGHLSLCNDVKKALDLGMELGGKSVNYGLEMLVNEIQINSSFTSEEKAKILAKLFTRSFLTIDQVKDQIYRSFYQLHFHLCYANTPEKEVEALRFMLYGDHEKYYKAHIQEFILRDRLVELLTNLEIKEAENYLKLLAILNHAETADETIINLWKLVYNVNKDFKKGPLASSMDGFTTGNSFSDHKLYEAMKAKMQNTKKNKKTIDSNDFSEDKERDATEDVIQLTLRRNRARRYIQQVGGLLGVGQKIALFKDSIKNPKMRLTESKEIDGQTIYLGDIEASIREFKDFGFMHLVKTDRKELLDAIEKLKEREKINTQKGLLDYIPHFSMHIEDDEDGTNEEYSFHLEDAEFALVCQKQIEENMDEFKTLAKIFD